MQLAYKKETNKYLIQFSFPDKFKVVYIAMKKMKKAKLSFLMPENSETLQLLMALLSTGYWKKCGRIEKN